MNTITHRAAAALRRMVASPRTSARRPNPGTADMPENLASRVEHLEAALEGLQDAVYRQDVVHDRQIADLRKQKPTTSDGRPWELRGERP